jgi:hypothetical protein
MNQRLHHRLKRLMFDRATVPMPDTRNAAHVAPAALTGLQTRNGA